MNITKINEVQEIYSDLLLVTEFLEVKNKKFRDDDFKDFVHATLVWEKFGSYNFELNYNNDELIEAHEIENLDESDVEVVKNELLHRLQNEVQYYFEFPEELEELEEFNNDHAELIKQLNKTYFE